MNIRMKVALSGTRNGEEWPPIGGIIDLPEDEANAYLTSDLATLPDVESATEDQSDIETATVKTTPKKRSGGLSKAKMQGD